MSRTLICTTYNETTQSCDVQAWVEQPSVLPQLTVEQGRALGQEIWFALLSVAVIKMFLNPSKHRRGFT